MSTSVASASASASVSASALVAQRVRDFLRSACATLLDLRDAEQVASLEESIETQEGNDAIARFVGNADVPCLFVERYGLSTELRPRSSIAFVKSREDALDGSKSLTSQIQVMTLSGAEQGQEQGQEQEQEVGKLAILQQYAKHVYSPLARLDAPSGAQPEMAALAQKVRELEVALEQCQRGTSVPKVTLPSPPALEAAAKSTTAAALKAHLEKFNASQVDQLFADLQLARAMGDTQESKEEFANEVNKSARLWPAEISRLTRLIDTSPFPGSAESETAFWKDLEARLGEIKEQLESSPILLTKIVLKRTNRVSEQLIRESEAELDRSLELVQLSVAFLRDFPIEELLAATDLHPKLSRSVSSCLQHFSKLKHSRYDFSRAVRLLETLGGAVLQRLLSLLREKSVMQCSMEELRRGKKQADEVFLAWETQFAAQRLVLKDVAKRRNEKFIPPQLDQISLLQKRLAAVVEFREQHERLLSVFSVVLHGQENDVITELNEAWQLVLNQSASSDASLDISQGGSAVWNNVRSMYEKRLEKAEERVTRLLEDRLSGADSADDMFRIFSTFNALFFRPAIRNAVNSFRTTLVKNVREDVARLQEKFRLRYDDSLERVTANIRDIPPLSGRIIWARQIENQLSTLMKRMEDVLGAGWEDHVDGKQLKEVCDELRSYLGTDSLYNEWLSQQLKADTHKYAKTKDFLLLVDEDPRTMRKSLRVNFDDKQVVVFKEVRFLEHLLPTMTTAHKTIPLTIRSQSKEAYLRYPVAMALQSGLAAFAQAKRGINDANSLLLATHIQAIRDIVKEAFGGSKKSKRWIKWDSGDIEEWSSQLSTKVYALQERVDDVTEKIKKVDALLLQLQSCPYSRRVMADILAALQLVVDDMQVRGFANINAWVVKLDGRVEGIVSARLQSAVHAWVRAFLAGGTRDRDGEVDGGDSERDAVALDQTVHEVLLSNQILYLSPPLEQARREWIAAFHAHVAVITSLPRLISTRYQVFASSSKEHSDYADTLRLLPADVIRLPLAAIEDKLAAAHACVEQWLQYQALWDASVAVASDRLGNDIGKWQQLLTEIRSARVTIDSAEDERSFGPIVVNHRQVQKRVNDKYDSWQKETQQRFGAILADEARTAHSDFVACKARLESIYLEGGGAVKDVIIGVEFILKTKATLDAKKALAAELESSEKLLRNQRHTFPATWLPISNVTSALDDLCQILQRRVAVMDTQLPSLQRQIKEEDVHISGRTEELIRKWEVERPVGGGMAPGDVVEALSVFSAQVSRLVEDGARVRGAKEALGLEFLIDDRLERVRHEIADLKEAWLAVAPVHDKLHSLRVSPVRDVIPAKIRKSLEDLAEELKLLPAKVRSYAAVEAVQERLVKHLGMQSVLRDLCTEALKERHWKALLQGMGVARPLGQSVTDITLGMIWDSNPHLHKKLISEVLATAQGELALEQFLRDLREQWLGCELSLAARDGVRLIVGWDVLFSALEDNLNSLASLKQSPYFRNVPEYQEDTASWEARLANLRAIFDIWVEVQRKWVYLRGIFRNPDIKAQLPAQFSKFKSVDNEFMGLMKRVAQKPSVMDLLQLDNLARQLERQDATMTLIQKALGEYLEKQRQIFPRFYFVNNDDLVEIIGNSNEPAKIVTHLGKMFSALTVVEMTTTQNDDGASIVMAHAMCSKEGEVVPLNEAVNMSAQGVKEWLNALEGQMALSLATILERAFANIPRADKADAAAMLGWIDQYPAQIVILSSQIAWTLQCEEALDGKDASGAGGTLGVQQSLEGRLRVLSESVLHDMAPALRKKMEQLLTEMIHQRDVARLLVAGKVSKKTAFEWLYHLRFYWSQKETQLMQKLCIKMSNASFFYGFEYLGVGERLVQTPLTDRCYLTLTQALHFRMGANPFGPAGTGKTESVKMLGAQLGRFVLVFNCDSSFDYAAMGRIFAGLCQVGAWGCFDEFNRLEERILSAVSQQILTIQRGLMLHQDQIELMGHPTQLKKEVGIFVTLNPGYAGRSNLPDNLKQLFRAVAMVVPDRKLIAQVMLFAQGIVTAEDLAGKIVLLFNLCEEQLSQQSHYDFGLRALKSVLTGAGELKRAAFAKSRDLLASNGEAKPEPLELIETKVLIASACDSILPKLVAEDTALFTSLLQAVFVGCEMPSNNDSSLVEAIKAVCLEDALECGDKWIDKVLQLKQVLDMRHGVMLVGPSCSGKTTAWRTLLKALARLDGSKGDFHVIDPKSIKKEKLYGSLDANTLEWTDGVFTKVLRRIADAASNRGSVARRSWIVFDGDVDPEWAENLNSVLDDNKILTLPTGDRLKLPDNVRIMMEVDTLQHATMATVSRCGMVWFAFDTISLEIVLRQMMQRLRVEAVPTLEASTFGASGSGLQKSTQMQFCDAIAHHFSSAAGLVSFALSFSLQQAHVMEATQGRLMATLHTMLLRGISTAIDCNETNSFPMSDASMDLFANKWLLYSILWAFGGSMFADRRSALGDLLIEHSNTDLPKGMRLIDVHVNVQDGAWVEWAAAVPKVEIEAHRVTASDVVITTTDTLRHVEVLKAWLASHRPLILCGPPGSGKTMTLTSVLESMPEFVLAALNFSSNTTPDLILKTFAQYCEVVDSPDGLIMQPTRQTYRESQWLVVFCDEINLPQLDRYGTQTVIMFLRQLTEQGGFWNGDCKWVSLRRIQFVGACNPPTDAGRIVMSSRFLRHVPLLLVDYPAEASLKQIYRCFNHALLKLHPSLRGANDSLNDAMVDFYLGNQTKFTPDLAPQYVYSPRELSRWVRAMYEAMEPLEAMTMHELVRLWAHEALRLFQDRLVTEEDKEWCEAQLNETARKHFTGVDMEACMQRPMLFSNWIKKTYQSTDREALRDFVSARLRVFYEEELDVPLVIFDDVLEHVLRIDNVLRHPMGHLLLVGESGVGKTVLSRFVSWMNGLSVFQVKANHRYTLEQFDDDLRGLLRRVGVDGEKICFIFDESNVLSSAFLERMNALLASGEVPGLFEGDDRTQLLSSCREMYSHKEGLLMDSEDEIWRRFTKLIQRNLHVVFTMNPASSDFENRCTASPALFNRCVVDWFGTWSQAALAQVGFEFTLQLDTGYTEYVPAHRSEMLGAVAQVLGCEAPGLREAVVAALVSIHGSVKGVTTRMAKHSGRQHFLSPRDFLDVIKKFVGLEREKREYLEEHQTHIRTGLQKLLETQDQVGELRKEMVGKEAVLKGKDAEANLKLQQMVEKQNEAEQRKTLAEQLTLELQVQNEEIRVRRETVEGELSEAEPALLSAKQSVQAIKKQQLDEVRALARPPKPVQLTMEMVCIMMGEKNLDWAEIRKVVRRDDFIPVIVNFDPMTLTQKQVQQVQADYMQNPELDYASVERASKACGPLYQWAESQIKYATIIRKIKPLRDEVAALQEKGNEMEVRQKETVEQVGLLEESIRQYKAEYATAIRDTETIRAEMDLVSKKVGRAESLLRSLEQEKVRWQATSASFDRQMSTLIGDSLLAAAFLTYAGIFDHRARRSLMQEWTETLEALNVPFQPSLDLVNYLSKPAEHMVWKGHGLPTDELALQNAILLERFHRYPLMIDPSGQATNYILQKYAAQKIVTTSFLDASFLKTLASAIRFGTPLMVQDVETVDPVLNPVLNRELQKTGGRTLIRLGSEDIDFSPKFMIILSTRNPLARFAPDVCSRVTMVNFTVTPASLESQALSAILKAERPDVDRRRTELLRLQAEQSVKLRELEEMLLNKISAVQGAILDDDSVINTLESIKAEAAEVNREVLKTQQVMDDVKAVSNSYVPLASAMAAVYFSLERLADISFLYQFSLQFFLDTIARVLSSSASAAPAGGEVDSKFAKQRLQVLSQAFFAEVSRRVLRGLKFDDKLMFVARLAQIATQGQASKGLTDVESDFLLRGASSALSLDASSSTVQALKSALPGRTLPDGLAMQLASLVLLPAFSGLPASLAAEAAQWTAFMDSPAPEAAVPAGWVSADKDGAQVSAERRALLHIMLVRVLRPERVLSALERYVSAVLGDDFGWRALCSLDLGDIVRLDSTASSPLMLCSEAGQDASGKVDALARSLGKQLLQVSMGSHEGYTEADKSIAMAAKTGSWVLLRNVHLCPEWLGLLEKRLHGFSSHENFRLFLTSEMSSALPSALLRASEVLVGEASTGIKANIQRFLAGIPAQRIDKQPAERARLYGLLGWLNAVIQERLRYLPLGWSKKYEFNETDAACALDVIDQWVDELAGSRAHVSPEDLPWQALRTLLSQSIYGGRIDHPFDQSALDSFIDSVFTPQSYGATAAVVSDASGAAVLTLPDGLSRPAFEAWVKLLPDSNSPAWLGLPVTAESQLQSVTGQRVLSKLAVLQGAEEEAHGSGGGSASGLDASSAGSSQQPDSPAGLRQRSMLGATQRWLKLIPPEAALATAEMPVKGSSPSKDTTADPIAGMAVDSRVSPVQRALAREVIKARAALALVTGDVRQLLQHCQGELKATNYTRELLLSCGKGQIPAQWRGLYTVGPDATLEAWLADLSQRLRCLEGHIPMLLQAREGRADGPDALRVRYWVGGLFSPETFITATRQHAAQAQQWSLEELELYLEIGCADRESAQDVIVEGLLLEGAHWADGAKGLSLSDSLRCPLPPSRLRWRQRQDKVPGCMSFPMYLNETRAALVGEVLVLAPTSSAVPPHIWAQRGVCFVLTLTSS